MDIRTNPRIQMGFPRGHEGRSEIRLRHSGRVLGTVREVEATPRSSRWFAEDETGFPIEGTFSTKSDAAVAVAREAGEWKS